MPYADPERRRKFQRARAEQRRALGLCASCNNKARPGRSRCQECADRWTAFKREERRAAQCATRWKEEDMTHVQKARWLGLAMVVGGALIVSLAGLVIAGLIVVAVGGALVGAGVVARDEAIVKRGPFFVVPLVFLALFWMGFVAGRLTSDDNMAKGYTYGNHDGYSVGYNDGQRGAELRPHRSMDAEDYALRDKIGGRPKGQ